LSEEEFNQLLKVKPDVLQTLLLFKMYKKLDKLSAFVTFMGPMTHRFKRELQFQCKTVPAGKSATVFKLENPQPELLVGIITQVANDWYPRTFLEWFIDHEPKRVEYVIAEIENPKEYERGIPFHQEIRWVAHNNDWTATETYDPAVGWTFGVLCDGFFIDKKLYKKIVAELS